jgi:uncharacterized protein YndB with AHSA1/START domain
MKILQWTLAAIGAIALVIVGAGFFLPSAFLVQRSVVINAPDDRIYDYIVEPKEWTKWSVWTRRDPKMDITYGGPPFGQGARWSWKSKSEGSGTMEFTRVEPNRRIEYSLMFPEFGMRSTGEFRIEPGAGGARVTWTNAGDVGTNPLKHYLAAAMDHIVGPDFESGLANLKALAEKP